MKGENSTVAFFSIFYNIYLHSEWGSSNLQYTIFAVLKHSSSAYCYDQNNEKITKSKFVTSPELRREKFESSSLPSLAECSKSSFSAKLTKQKQPTGNNKNQQHIILTTPWTFDGADDGEGKKAGLTCGTGAWGWPGGGPLCGGIAWRCGGGTATGPPVTSKTTVNCLN